MDLILDYIAKQFLNKKYRFVSKCELVSFEIELFVIDYKITDKEIILTGTTDVNNKIKIGLNTPQLYIQELK